MQNGTAEKQWKYRRRAAMLMKTGSAVEGFQQVSVGFSSVLLWFSNYLKRPASVGCGGCIWLDFRAKGDKGSIVTPFWSILSGGGKSSCFDAVLDIFAEKWGQEAQQ